MLRFLVWLLESGVRVAPVATVALTATWPRRPQKRRPAAPVAACGAMLVLFFADIVGVLPPPTVTCTFEVTITCHSLDGDQQ